MQWICHPRRSTIWRKKIHCPAPFCGKFRLAVCDIFHSYHLIYHAFMSFYSGADADARGYFSGRLRIYFHNFCRNTRDFFVQHAFRHYPLPWRQQNTCRVPRSVLLCQYRAGHYFYLLFSQRCGRCRLCNRNLTAYIWDSLLPLYEEKI